MSVNFELFRPENGQPHVIANAIRNATHLPAQCSLIEFYAVLEHAAKHAETKWWAACLRFGRAIWMIQGCDQSKWPEAHEELRRLVVKTWDAFTEEVNNIPISKENATVHCIMDHTEPMSSLMITDIHLITDI